MTTQTYRFQTVTEVADHLGRLFHDNGLRQSDVTNELVQPFVWAIVSAGQLRSRTVVNSGLWARDVQMAMRQLD
jgi:hypothetical protein